MTLATDVRSRPAGGSVAPVAQRVHELRSRIERMQEKRLDERHIPVSGALAPLLPNGLRCGAAYRVEGSNSLLMALLAQASSAGTWSAVVGLPEFGVEAAAGFGLDLERLVFVPDAGRQWLGVVASLADAVSVVAVRPSSAVNEADAARLAARLRQRDCVLLALGPWPQTEAVLRVRESNWSGLDRGHGRLDERTARVEVSGRGGAGRTALLRLHGRALPAGRDSGMPALPPVIHEVAS